MVEFSSIFASDDLNRCTCLMYFHSLFCLLEAYDSIIFGILGPLVVYIKHGQYQHCTFETGLEGQNNWTLKKNKIASSFGGWRDLGKMKFGQRNGSGDITQKDEVNLLWRKGIF